MRNQKVLLFVLFAAVLVFASFGAAALARPQIANAQSVSQPVEPTRTINVNGTGKAYLTPDIASINVGVHVEAKSASEAVASSNSATQKVIDGLKAAGVAEKDIQTINFNIYPQQQFDKEGQPTGETIYMVDNAVYVTVRDLGKLGSLLDAAVKAGANSISGVSFDVADKEAALEEARKEAVANAQAVAQQVAAAAGVELGQVITINAYGGSYPITVFEAKGGAVAMDGSVPVSPGQLVLTVDVNIVYAIK